ncbi:MAG: hypothetical protein DRN68_04930 [Thaumarchaeota archaeon]|nr:MAG: hypothetical protein DRN68_04930 [Nitrososphaerota archaeon]
MPKRVVIKGPSDEDEEKKELIIEPVEETVKEEAKEVTVTPSISEKERVLEEASVEAEAAYETVMDKIDELKIREKVTQERFMQHPDMTLSILKKLLQKWDVLREDLIKNVHEALEKYGRLKSLLEERFSSIEEELYENQVELDVLHQREEQGKPISVSKKEELENLIPALREKMAEIDRKIKDIEKRMEELRHIADNVYDVTSYKELSEKLLGQIIEAGYNRWGEEADMRVRYLIGEIAQREGIPREYATIYLWKQWKERQPTSTE